MNIKTAVTLALFALGAPAALAQMQGMDMQKMMQMMTPGANDPASTKDFKTAHMNMMKNMNMEFTGDPDRDFAASMKTHHEGGIEMAKIQLRHGKDPEMRKMAEKLVKEQSEENKKFESWLSKHKK